jgi:hypothetical protein
MRNKQVIEQLCQRAHTVANLLLKDIDSNKPHMTAEYVKNQLETLVNHLENQQQYLDLED